MKTLAILLLSILPFICLSAPYQPNRYDTNTDAAAAALVAAQASAAAQAATNNYAPIVTTIATAQAQAVVSYTNIYYVSPTNSTGYEGTGLIFGSGAAPGLPLYGDFDAIISSRPSNSIVNLLPGTFSTVGSNTCRLTNNVSLVGAGIDRTFIRRDTNLAQIACAIITSANDNDSVSGLTVDAGRPTNLTVIAYGIHLFGNNENVDHVKVMNWGGVLGVQEAWAIQLGTGTGAVVKGLSASTNVNNRISDCIVTNSWGTYSDCFEAEGQGSIKNCIGAYPPSTNVVHLAGINYAYANNLVCENNTFYGAYFAAYADSGGATNVTFQNNSFINVINGIVAYFGPTNNWVLQGMQVKGNWFEYCTNYFTALRGMILMQTRETNAPWNNIIIAGNSFGFYGGTPGFMDSSDFGLEFYSPNATNLLGQNIPGQITGVSIIGNRIDNRFINGFTAVTGLLRDANIDQNGNWLNNSTFTNDINPAITNVVNGVVQGAPIGVPQNPLNAGLLLDLSFIEGQGTNIYNYSGSYATPGYTPNASCTMVGGQYTWLPGQVGYSFSMTNSILGVGLGSLGSFTNYLSYSLPTSINGGSNFTAEVWVKQPAFGGNYSVPFSLYQSDSGDFFQLWLASGIIGINFTSASTNYAFLSGASYTDGNWHQLVGVYGGTNVVLYVDGSNVGSFSATGPLPASGSTSATLYLGATRVGGAVRECRLWNRALSGSEVQKVYLNDIPTLGSTFTGVDIPTNTLATHGYSGYMTNGIFITTGTY